MTNCKTCSEWLGIKRIHDVCPVRASAWCSQCGCYGHRPSECSNKMMWTRPATLEELIPNDIRERWGIQTSTRIKWSPPTEEDAQREIANINTIEIRHQGKKNAALKQRTQDMAIRDYMHENKIATAARGEDNIRILMKWAIDKGKKVVIIKEDG